MNRSTIEAIASSAEYYLGLHVMYATRALYARQDRRIKWARTWAVLARDNLSAYRECIEA